MNTHLDPELLLRAYAAGVFPMADSRDAPDIFWVEPKKRGILPLDAFHLSRSLRKIVKSDRFTVTVDQAFEHVVRSCAEPAPDREDSWINPPILRAYQTLFERGFAHSVECWVDHQLAGGLYGVSLGAAFFGESMFTRIPNASKVALAHLVARMKAGNFMLLDTQFLTAHLESLGAIEIPRSHYQSLLDVAVSAAGDFGALDALAAGDRGAPSAEADPRFTETVPGPVSGKLISQLLTQTS